MKLWISKSIIALVLGTTVAANAALYNQTFTYGGAQYSIPDGSQAGVSSQITVGGMNPTLWDITVTLNLSGGYNGDLYAYLSYNNVLVPLLNRVGVGSSPPTTSAFGYSDSGMHLVLSDSGAHGDIHLYQQVSGYSSLIANGTSSWTPDGRNINPLSTPLQFDAAASSRLGLDTTFGGMNPNGTWTLFFADVVQGGGQSQLISWSLDITAVPEPENVALGCFAGVFLVVSLVRSQRVRKRVHLWCVAVNQWLDAV